MIAWSLRGTHLIAQRAPAIAEMLEDKTRIRMVLTMWDSQSSGEESKCGGFVGTVRYLGTSCSKSN